MWGGFFLTYTHTQTTQNLGGDRKLEQLINRRRYMHVYKNIEANMAFFIHNADDQTISLDKAFGIDGLDHQVQNMSPQDHKDMDYAHWEASKITNGIKKPDETISVYMNNMAPGMRKHARNIMPIISVLRDPHIVLFQSNKDHVQPIPFKEGRQVDFFPKTITRSLSNGNSLA